MGEAPEVDAPAGFPSYMYPNAAFVPARVPNPAHAQRDNNQRSHYCAVLACILFVVLLCSCLYLADQRLRRRKDQKEANIASAMKTIEPQRRAVIKKYKEGQ